MQKVAFLGAGAWGFALANMLAKKGLKIVSWTIEQNVIDAFAKEQEHPRFPGIIGSSNLTITHDIDQALQNAEMIVESVTTAGVRPVFKKYRNKLHRKVPLVLTSKGIEQKSCLLLHEVAIEELGEEIRPYLGCLSGPSLATEVAREVPTSVVCSAYELPIIQAIQKVFNTPYFRVYPNRDISGVEFGGAMKNIIAIACGFSDGLGFGGNTKAALMTRGLHEMRKLAIAKGCHAETLNGLSGMGDLCVTCLSVLSRNYRFGFLIAEGLSPQEAKQKIGMVIEGESTCVSACQLGKKLKIALPISEAVFRILYENQDPKEAVRELLSREIKEEHL